MITATGDAVGPWGRSVHEGLVNWIINVIKHDGIVWLITMGLMGMTVACGTSPEPLDRHRVGPLVQARYPQSVPADDLDIVVVRDGPELVLTNRTARAFGQVVMWVNQQYVGIVDKIDIGAETRVPLSHLVDRHGEPFPLGGPLTPDKTRPVVLAELYTTQSTGRADLSSGGDRSPRRYRLLVRTSSP